jgi:hypothetical protein
MEQQKNEISIELNEQVAQGTYSNLAIITHSTSEFVVDFVRLMPGMPKAPVVSRVILTPEHAKRLLNALQDNVSKFEKSHGAIKVEGSMPPFPMNFGGNAAQA